MNIRVSLAIPLQIRPGALADQLHRQTARGAVLDSVNKPCDYLRAVSSLMTSVLAEKGVLRVLKRVREAISEKLGSVLVAVPADVGGRTGLPGEKHF